MYLACAATVALVSPAWAGSYTAGDETSLNTALSTAVGDGAPSSTITLTNNITLATLNVPAPGKPITIDTGGFTLSRTYANTTTSGVITLTGPYPSGAYTFNGAILGSDAGAGVGTGRVGIYMSQAAAINMGSITGGTGGGAGGAGGTGVSLTNTATLTNYGTITGGSSPNTVAGGGTGVFVQRGSTLTNYGAIQGGNGQTFGGSGVDIGAPGATATLINYGTIRGGTGSTGSGGVGVFFRNGAAPIVNNGTIEGGNGAAAIRDNSAPLLTVINSGTLKAGAGYATAIELISASQALTLELQKGSVIQGNVAANSGVTNTFRLGGDTNASFDVSTIGPQYQNFTNCEKTGNSIWTLTGTGGIATPWLVSQGTLQIGDGTATGSIIGTVTDNATLAFNRSDAFTFGNVISGSGGVNQVGSGKAILTAASTYTGPTTVTSGTLSVNGSITSAVTVSGGTLGGNGTVGATTIQSGGAVAPGNSIGTLHVNSAFVQNAGSIYQVEVDPTSNASDLILVNGTATIASGAALNVTKNPQGAYRLDALYTVLTASGGVTGSYAVTGDTALSQYLALGATQDANNVYLKVIQTGDPASAAQTPNQTNVGGAVDSQPPGGSIPTAVLNSQSPAETRSAFDALSGEAQASAKGALVAGSLLVRDASFDRLRELFCATENSESHSRPGCGTQDRPTPWVRGFGNWDHLRGNANAAGLSQSTAGFLAGVDVPVYDWRFGVFGGYSRTDFDVTARASSGASNNYHLGVYGGTQWGDMSLKLGASYSWNGVATDRAVAIGAFANALRARYNAGTTQIFGEVGERFTLDDFVLEPFVNVAHVKLRTDGFSEAGGDAALTSRAGTTENIFATLGVRPATTVSWDGFDATLRGMLGWRHAFGSVTPVADVAFATGPVFTVEGAAIARDSGVVEAGADFAIAHGIAFGATYGGQFSGPQTSHGVRGTITMTF